MIKGNPSQLVEALTQSDLPGQSPKAGEEGPSQGKGRLVLRYGLVFLLLFMLLVPHNWLWDGLWPLLFGVPLLWTALRGDDVVFRAWATYAVAFVLFIVVRSMADVWGPGPFGEYVITADRLLAFGRVPTLELQRAYTPGSVAWWDWAALFVYMTHFVLTPLIGVVLWRTGSPRLRPFLLGLASLYLAAIVIHVAIPTMPPWVAAHQGLLPTIYRPVMDLLDGWSPGFYQYGLSVAGGNDVAAMPSIHQADAMMVTIASMGTRWASLGWLYSGLMGLSLVYLGEHYVIDLLVGAGMALGCWWLFARRAG